ncbi:hypothetical protein PIB30_055457 [Stylosanthes scabra]|uniref:Putative plant transposon protein domain-containing protein n=1 Tax=Stylosanthes scabra TaxID=79078 RepID=A0ABU6XIV8_9FABA|nr:hypothetical protein [Stylosanthes scabra]
MSSSSSEGGDILDEHCFRSKEEMEDLEVHPYTSHVRGVQVNFSSANIRRVMRFKEEIPGAENNFDNRQTRDPQLDAVIRDLCIQRATWKMGTSRNPKPIQLRRQELRPLARGWQELIIHNIIPTGNKSEITISRVVLMHSIIQGDDVRAEEFTADNMVIIAQGIEGFQKLNEQIANMQIGIQTAQGKYIEEVQGMKGKQQDLYNYMKEKHKFLAKELDEIKRFQVGQTMMASHTDTIDKLNMTMEEHRNEMIMIKRQLKEWTKNASYKDAYCCWAHQQSNPNLTEIPKYKILAYMKENGEKGRSIFYGCLKFDFQTGSSSQAAPTPPPQEDEQMAEPDS